MTGASPTPARYADAMERVANRALSFADAQRWDREQMWAMTPEERLDAARILRERVYGPDAPDVRAAERSVGSQPQSSSPA